jgi:hypothetical protein
VTTEWLEDAVSLRAGVTAMEADKTRFRRVIRGLNTLFNGLKETGQDRLHQFVRAALMASFEAKRAFSTLVLQCQSTRFIAIPGEEKNVWGVRGAGHTRLDNHGKALRAVGCSFGFQLWRRFHSFDSTSLH